MKIDYHIHSQFSSDSSTKMEQIIEKAIQRGYKKIAFSDHFDLVPSEIAIYGVPSYYQFSKAISRMRQKYDNIKILKGVELGEYHECSATVDKILSIDPPDIKIGAIHILPPLDKTAINAPKENISLPLKQVVTPELIRSYYQENLKLVRHGNFDILAHLGVYKRYLPESPDEESAQDIIAEIFAEIIAKDIALEVNLSGLRKSLASTVPDIPLLKKYLKMGGKRITIGSDTHHIDDFDVFYDETYNMLHNLGFKQINV